MWQSLQTISHTYNAVILGHSQIPHSNLFKLHRLVYSSKFKSHICMVLSCEDLTKVSSGRVIRHWKQLKGPTSVCIHFSVFRSQTCIRFRDPMAIRSRDKTFKRRIKLVQAIVFRQTPSLGFQTLSDFSLKSLIKWPVTNAFTQSISSVWPSSVRMYSFVSRSHNLNRPKEFFCWDLILLKRASMLSISFSHTISSMILSVYVVIGFGFDWLALWLL